MRSGSGGLAGLGVAMAVEAARSLLDDHLKMQAVVLLWPGDSQPAGPCGMVISPTGLDPQAADGASAARGFRITRVRSDKAGRLRAVGRAEAIEPATALAQLEETLRETAGARLALLSRGGSVEFRFEAQGNARRLPISPDDEYQLLALIPDPTPVKPDTGEPSIVASSAHTGWLPLPLDQGRGLDAGRSARLLEALGVADQGGRIRRDQRRKFNQISHLAALAREALQGMPRHRQLLVVDSACGTSQLLMVLNHLAVEELGLRARFVGIDQDPKAVERARALQARLGYANMEFVTARISSWQAPEQIDVVVSLHACDTATDEALALGVTRRAKAIMAVPCCQAEVASQIELPRLAPALAHGILRRRLGDWLTDAVRCLVLEAHGYDVRVVEYVSPLDTPKNLMLMAIAGEKSRSRRHAARQALDALLQDYAIDPSLPRLIVAGEVESG